MAFFAHPTLASTENVVTENNTAYIEEEGKCGENLKYTLDSDGVLTITGTGEMWEGLDLWDNSDVTKVIIGKGVTNIADEAFENSYSLTSISISETVTKIGEQAFYESGISNISIPSNVKSIGSQAFKKCTNLQKATLTNGLKTIEKYAFADCTSLKEITIPSSVTTIGNYAFYNCSITTLTLSTGLKTIGERAFSCCDMLTTVSIPSGVATIDEYAFYCCSRLGTVVIPGTVKEIGRGSFNWCTNLKNVTLKDGIKVIGHGAFSQCENLESITIPGSVDKIEDEAFLDCFDLETISIKEGVKEIERCAFYWCKNLKKITIPYSVTSIAGNAFSYCPDNLVIHCPKNSTAHKYAVDNKRSYKLIPRTYRVDFNKNGGTNLQFSTKTVTKNLSTMPTVKRAGYAFKGWYTAKSGGTKVTTKTNLTRSLTLYAQWGKQISSTKTKVTLSTTKCYYNGSLQKPTVKSVKYGNTTLKAGTDYTVSYVNNRNIGTAKVVVKGKGKYVGTIKRTFTISEKVGKIHTVGNYKYKITATGKAAFAGLAKTSITKVTVYGSVKIGGKTFKVTSITGSALKGKNKITSLIIGSNIKAIGSSAFRDCSKLSNVKINSKVLNSIGSNAFKGIKSTAKIQVPSSKFSTYKTLLKGKGLSSKASIVKY